MFVGLCGPIGSGKTTAAKYLVEEYGFERIPFAKVLKEMGKAFGLTNAQLYGDEKEIPTQWGFTPRHFMQTLGTEWGRKYLGPNIWVDIWKHHAKAFKRVVADDVRFPNEVQAVHDLGGKVILIDRGIKWADGQHVSESWLTLGWDVGLANGETIDSLHQRLERVIWPDVSPAKNSPAISEHP